MTKVSRHTYTAENDLGTVLSVPAGSITLDSAAIPHVKASLTLSVEDAALLDELDPRDSRRITIGATGDGHEQRIYTPWVEQRRNWHSNPRNGGAVSGGLALGNVAYTAASGAGTPTVDGSWQEITATALPTPGTSRYGFRRSMSAIAATNAPITIKITARGISALPAGVRPRVYADFNDGGTFRGAISAFLVDGENTIVGSFPAGPTTGVQFYVWLDTPTGTPFVGPAKIGVTNALVESGTSGEPFDGSTIPATELERTRWIGAANASASVLETRAISGVDWVPEGFRYFDLGIRSTSPNRADGTVAVELASDEAILEDFAQLVDDETPFTLAPSLRAVVNYVLSKIGAALEAGPEDADLTPYWEVTNLLRNPAVVTNLNNWAGGGGCTIAFVSGPTSGEVGVTATAATGAVFAVDPTKYNIPATPGTKYTFTLMQRNVSGGGNGYLSLRFLDNNNATISEAYGDPVQMENTANQVTVTAVAPPSAVKVAPIWRFNGSSGRTYRLDQGLLHTSRFPVGYFSGGNVGPNYTYHFEGPSNDSASIRTPDIERDPESLVWNAGVSAMEFLQPLLMSVGLRLVCDEQRRFTLRSEDYRAAGSQSWRYGVNIETADEKLSREDQSWFDAAVYVYVWTDSDGIEQTRTDAYALTSDPTKVLRRVLDDTPFPGPGRAQHVVQRAQGKGREVTISGIPSWSEQTDQSLAVLLDGTPIQTGISARIRYDLDTDTVAVTSRTTDTPAYAWQLIPAGEAWLDSPVGASWIGEVI